MRRTTYRIAAILPVEPEYSSRLLHGAINYGVEHPDVELVEISYIRGDRKGRSPLPEGPLGIDGAMVWLHAQDTWVERLLDEEIVVVDAAGEWHGRGIPAVGFDGPHAEKLAIEHLAGLGREHAAYVGIDTSHSVELKRRRNSFFKGLWQQGIKTEEHEIDPGATLETRVVELTRYESRRLRRFLAKLPGPAAIWCEDDYIARLVCDHAALEGLRVPEDLAVLGIGDYSVARLGTPTISSIPQPGELVGERLIELIHQVLSGEVEAAHDVPILSPPVAVRESTGVKVQGNERFDRIRQWIHDHACEGLTVNDLVKMLPMSQFTFTKHFARLYGHTPGEEIRKVKTERARHYLRATTFSVERIAGLCGFEQPGKFSKFFKRQTGVTPSEYRKEERPPEELVR